MEAAGFLHSFREFPGFRPTVLSAVLQLMFSYGLELKVDRGVTFGMSA